MTFAKFTVERRRADTAGRETTDAQRLMVQTLLSLTEVRDAETGRHSRRTQQYARLLAEQLATHPDFRDYLTPERIDLLSSLAPLHDIGKVGVPDHILNKPAPLTPEELVEMRKHPTLGRDVILKAEAAGRRARRCDAGDGEGHRLHASRAMGRDRISAGPARHGHSHPGTGDGDRGRVRRRRRPDALSADDVARGHRQLHRPAARARTSIRPWWMRSCGRPMMFKRVSAESNH